MTGHTNTIIADGKLPFPYTPHKYEFERMSFEEYRKMVYGWVEENTKTFAEADGLKNFISGAFDLVQKPYHREIKWLIDHSDKVRDIFDFSGLSFGVYVDEESEMVGICYPTPLSSKLSLFEGYDASKFSDMTHIGRLEWMYQHCEFIPFRILHEDYFDYMRSHRYSHWKRDRETMNRLKGFLANAKYPPNDRVFYFMKFSKDRGWYLQRDFEKSPKVTKR